jgi:ornithine carbamoyltransferase
MVLQAPGMIGASFEKFHTGTREGGSGMEKEKRDFISLKDLSVVELQKLLKSAFDIKANPAKYAGSLKGKALALIFEKPSLRTRVSFDVGIHQLGGFSVYLSPSEINLGLRESIHDVAKTLDRMVQGIMVRTFAHENVLQMAEAASVPVINGLTDFSHPCQGLADYMTIVEAKKNIRKIKIAYIGDGNNVAHSLIYGAALTGARLTVATPSAYAPDDAVTRWAQAKARETGCEIEVVQDPIEAASAADVVYTDVWTSMGQERESARRRKIFKPYQINETLFRKAKPDAVFMHCLPAHRGEEVTEGVIGSSRSIVFQQAENRVHAQKAILLSLMS